MSKAIACRLLFICVWAFLSFPQAGCAAEDVPKAAGEDPYAWDFGQALQGEVLKHDFTLKNESGKTLNISGINTSCGCTASKVEKTSLAPGESVPIEVSFDTKGYSGKVEQFVYVNTDDVDNPVTRFIIKAEVSK